MRGKDWKGKKIDGRGERKRRKNGRGLEERREDQRRKGREEYCIRYNSNII